MRHLFVAALMVIGALLVTATTAGVLQSRATSGNNVSNYEPPSLAGPSSRTAKAVPKASTPEPAVIGVRARSNAPRKAPSDQRV